MHQTCALNVQYYGCVEDKADKEAVSMFLELSYILQFEQIHFAIGTNTFCYWDIYFVQFYKIQCAILWTKQTKRLHLCLWN